MAKQTKKELRSVTLEFTATPEVARYVYEAVMSVANLIDDENSRLLTMGAPAPPAWKGTKTLTKHQAVTTAAAMARATA